MYLGINKKIGVLDTSIYGTVFILRFNKTPCIFFTLKARSMFFEAIVGTSASKNHDSAMLPNGCLLDAAKQYPK